MSSFAVAFFFLAVCSPTVAQSPPAGGAARTPVTWLIFVDDLHLDFRNTGRLRDMLRTIVKELVQDGDQVAFASSGPSSLAVDATKDREQVALEIRKATGNALKYGDMRDPYGSAEALYRASISLTRAQAMLTKASLAASDRKALLYVSNGYSFDTLPDPAPSAFGGRQRVPTRSEVAQQLAELTVTATQSGVRIFAIGPRPTLDLDDPALRPPIDPAWPAFLLGRQTFLRSISEKTAGFAVIDGDLVTELRRIAEMVRK